MSDTPPGNPQSRGDKRPSSRAGAQAASFLTHLTEVRKLEPRLAEGVAGIVLTHFLHEFESGEEHEADHLARKFLELLPARPATPAPAPEPVAPELAAVEDLPEPPALLAQVATVVGPGVDVEPPVRAVFQGLREYLSEGEALEVERTLTWDLQNLWRRTQ
jgi:hypothetical protein